MDQADTGTDNQPLNCAGSSRTLRICVVSSGTGLCCGLGVPAVCEMQFCLVDTPSFDVMTVLRAIYEYADRHFDKYEISEKSIDMEIDLQHWHFCYL